MVLQVTVTRALTNGSVCDSWECVHKCACGAQAWFSDEHKYTLK